MLAANAKVSRQEAPVVGLSVGFRRKGGFPPDSLGMSVRMLAVNRLRTDGLVKLEFCGRPCRDCIGDLLQLDLVSLLNK